MVKGKLWETAVPVVSIAFGFYVLEALLLVVLKPYIITLLKSRDENVKKASGVATQAVARIVGALHNAIQVPLAFVILLDPKFYNDRVYATSTLSTWVCYISAGYFLHDMIICALRVDLEGPLYLIHALCCHLAYLYGGYTGFIHFHGTAFLLWEMSTPFVHLRWFLYKLKYDHTQFYVVNGVLMVLAFFFFRIVWGYYSSYLLVTDVIKQRYIPGAAFPVEGTIAYCIAAVVMNTLNTFWFVKMTQRALEVVWQGKKATEVGREKDE